MLSWSDWGHAPHPAHLDRPFPVARYLALLCSLSTPVSMSSKAVAAGACTINNRTLARHVTKDKMLLTNPWTLFIAENYTKNAGKGGSFSSTIKNLGEKYRKLAPNALSGYKKQAEKNRAEIQKRMTVLKQAVANPFGMFVKENYAKVASEVKGEGLVKSQNVIKQL